MGQHPNYFTCTLGQAAQKKKLHNETPFATVIDLIDRRSVSTPESPALGFAEFQNESRQIPPFVTFAELQTLSRHASQLFLEQLGPKEPGTAIALMCMSSLDFASAWLGLMRLGYSVLLLAPGLGPAATKHLCDALKIEVIATDETCYQRAGDAGDSFRIVRVPNCDRQVIIEPLNTSTSVSQIACFFHTSGTSSGLPKPIPQSHKIVSALSSFPGQQLPATFSTTPLYHGGLADCLRAWAAGALIWMYPEDKLPLTGSNIIKAVHFARQETAESVQYFSSVPYVLEMLAEDDHGVRLLQSMDLVGYGGAGLSTKTGDNLVAQHVRLLSRFGSAECGFLMSSHRDYANDHDWRYLRSSPNETMLSFEPRQDGLSELVVKPEWPFMSKTNREDGSYATADLLEPHPTAAGAWRYHSRADAQIILANGKKFDPDPLERAIVSSSHVLQDVLVFGSGRDYAGALLFPKSVNHSPTELVGHVWPHISKLNRESPSHTRISEPMLIVVNGQEEPLEKSSKGTILRKQAEERYRNEIESAYSGRASTLRTTSIAELRDDVLKCFDQVLGRSVDPDRDLYQQGVDSLSCIQIRKLLETGLGMSLPINLLYDQGTVANLSSHLYRLAVGDTLHNDNGEVLQAMEELVQKYSSSLDSRPPGERKVGRNVVLTGATGFLGCHILGSLQQKPDIDTIICLCRADSSETAHTRLSNIANGYGITAISNKVACLPVTVDTSRLGLSEELYSWLRNKATHVIHAAWTVNFTLRLSSFEDQVHGTKRLMDLAADAGAKFLFVSSTAAVSASADQPISEALSTNPEDASLMGYSRSKWVAENVCASAEDQDVTILRVGQLCGSEMGIWNMNEAFPLMLSTASAIGCLPSLPQTVLDWLPVETAARAVVDACYLGNDDKIRARAPVYHVLNSSQSPSWDQLMAWLKDDDDGPAFDVVSLDEWIQRLEAFVEGRHNHPSHPLLGLWKGMSNRAKGPYFSTAKACNALQAMSEAGPLSQERCVKIWRWVNQRSRGKQ